jgi:hypothetical protein
VTVPDEGLTAMQREVLHLFFDLPESAGFVLAGGAALIASGLSERPTQDIDLFTSDLALGIVDAADALEAACSERGWTVERIRDAKTFRRVVVRSSTAELLVDVAVDSPPLGAPTITALGPTYPPAELAARKLLALFDRAAARDFVDVRSLADHFDLDELLDLAAQLDEGFDRGVFVDMLATLDRYTDDDLAEFGTDPTELRNFIEGWRRRLDSTDP